MVFPPVRSIIIVQGDVLIEIGAGTRSLKAQKIQAVGMVGCEFVECRESDAATTTTPGTSCEETNGPFEFKGTIPGGKK